MLFRSDNKLLGQFDLVGLPPALRGLPQIEVAFDIDANGLVNVTAKDKATGKEQQIRIQASGGLSDSDIETMVREAETHAEEDKSRRALVEARNQADSLIHATEKNIGEYGDQVGEDDKKTIEDAIAALRSTLEGEDTEAISAATEALGQASMKLGEAMYKAQAESEATADGGDDGGDQGDGGSDGAQSADDDIVDADFEEVDDDKKSESA